MAADERRVTLLGLLDVSAAFDCIDHAVLLEHLRSAVGLTDSVLYWVRSFLTDRTQQITYGGQLSTVRLQPMLFWSSSGIRIGPVVVHSVHG